MIYIIILFVVALWIFLFSGWDQLIVYLLLINIIIYAVRRPLINLVRLLVKKKIVQVFVSSIISVIWGFFIFWLIFLISTDLFVAMVSYILVAVAFTLKDIINNMTAGAIMLTSEQFELGDLIETNNIQGTVKQISLNHTKLREFDGVSIILPNSIVYSSPLVKFSHKRYGILNKEQNAEDIEDDKSYKKYMKKLEKTISKKKKVTRYVKTVEFLGQISPEQLDISLNKVFDKYETLLKYRPDYSVGTTTFGRIRVFLYLISESADQILQKLDCFLRDIAYEVYNELIFDGWETYKKQQLESTPTEEVTG